MHPAIPRLMMKNDVGEWERVASFSEYAMGKVGEIPPDDSYRVLPKDGLIQWANYGSGTKSSTISCHNGPDTRKSCVHTSSGTPLASPK